MSFSPPSAEVAIPSRAGRRGPLFTVLEMVIIAVVLGVVAFLVVPRYSNAQARRNAAVLRDVLQHLRTQILIYRAEHQGMPPGFPDGNLKAEPSVEVMHAQLTQFTDIHGRTSPVPSSQFRFGPYLTTLPDNPLRMKSSLRMLRADDPMPATPRGDEAWVYHPRHGLIAANLIGADEFGVDFFDY